MLSPLEKACLRWVSRGKTLAEIALIEGKSVPEIQLYLQRALVALEAKSINEAIEKTNLSQSD
ncbi:LuxR C-terminal-related transcriptional regulator (plasmid) [Rhizobium sp. RCAM05350]|nr:LuxR C-terminal-related transcriptional regulator [Rhizobium sp. RCAM05350]